MTDDELVRLPDGRYQVQAVECVNLGVYASREIAEGVLQRYRHEQSTRRQSLARLEPPVIIRRRPMRAS